MQKDFFFFVFVFFVFFVFFFCARGSVTVTDSQAMIGKKSRLLRLEDVVELKGRTVEGNKQIQKRMPVQSQTTRERKMKSTLHRAMHTSADAVRRSLSPCFAPPVAAAVEAAPPASLLLPLQCRLASRPPSSEQHGNAAADGTY